MENEIISKVKSVASIKEVIEDFIPLKRSGSNYVCCCPFHEEKTPSFYVNVKKNTFTCYGADHSHGDVFTFIQLYKKCSFTEAVKYLADRYGIETTPVRKSYTEEERSAFRARKRMLYTAHFMADSFSRCLYGASGSEALEYLKFKRQFNDESIKEFSLGFSSNCNFNHCKEAREHGYGKKDLQNIRVIRDDKDGKSVDVFSGRVVFPIQNEDGDIVAFAGRSFQNNLKNNTAKYINSATSDIYSKSSTLYGLYQAKEAIVREKNVIVVEGYCDVISMHQKGIKNVVASCGTAFTQEHAKLLRRFLPSTDGKRTVTLMFDGDKAGCEANIKAGKTLLSLGFDVNVIPLPSTKDADDFARENSIDAINEYMERNTIPFLRFFANVLKNSVSDDKSEKNAILNDILEILEKL